MQGIGASPGIAMGKVFVKHDRLTVERCTVENPRQEIERFRAAQEQSRAQLERVAAHTRETASDQEAAIFEAQLLILSDPELAEETIKKIEAKQVNAAWAVKEVAKRHKQILESLDDEYLRERAIDVTDVSLRVIRNLLGIENAGFTGLVEPSIIIARDLTPSDTAQIPREKALGFITEKGNTNAHTAIMARALAIPAIVGCGSLLDRVRSGDTAAMDGESGAFHINPGEGELRAFAERKRKGDNEREAAGVFFGVKSATGDGHELEITCNIGGPRDLEKVMENDGDGVGLYRTEFLYMDRSDLPTEEEQFEAYRKVAACMGDKPVVIRTLDIGGDKEVPYLDFPVESNPFLGLRGIRFCLQERQLFLTQLKAILRAAACGNVKVMFPMISNRQELAAARELLAEAAAELKKRGLPFNPQVKVGIMIEVPAAALLSDQLAREVDFFSIGMNDLIQYTIAVDRMNEKVAELYTAFHPALLRLIKMVIDSAHSAGIRVAMCGEAARDPRLIPLLVGMGLNEFSVNPAAVLKVRKLISGLHKQEIESHLSPLLALTDTESVLLYIDKYISPTAL